MAERMDIEDFFEEIDPGLLKWVLIKCNDEVLERTGFLKLRSGSSRRTSTAYPKHGNLGTYCIRNWLKIQQDVAFIKKNFKSGTLPSREMVKFIVEKKYQGPLGLIEQRSSARKRQNPCSPMEFKLASYGIEFPDKRSRRSSVSLLTPNPEEEEEEQFQMAKKLSLVDEPCGQEVCVNGTTSQNLSLKRNIKVLLG